MQIAVKQIRQDELSAFIINTSSGSAFSGNLESYTAANGFLGYNILYVTGMDQSVAGTKTFLINPLGNYTGGTGNFIVRQAVIDLTDASIESYSGFANQVLFQKSGSNILSGTNVFITPITVGLPTNTGHAVRLIDLQLASGILSTGLSNIVVSNVVYQTGDQSITGQKTFVSSPAVPTTPTNVTGAINLLYLSGVSGVLSSAGGGGTPNAVTTTGNEVIGGFKQFTGSPLVPAPTQPSGVVNLSYLSGVSGVLANSVAPGSVTITGNEQILGQKSFTGSPFVPTPIELSGAVNLSLLSGASGSLITTIVNTSGVLYDLITGSSGVGGGTTINNTFNITGTGTVNNTFESSGGVINNTFNDYTTQEITQYVTVTGNFTNISFFFDEYSFITGVNLSEVFVGRNFILTGYSLGLITSGTVGTTSGSLYQRTLTNNKTIFANFEINNGLLSYVSGGLSQQISGMNRVGIDILAKASGATGLCVGLFGGET